MKSFSSAALLVTGLLALTACGGKSSDGAGNTVEQAYDNQADALDAQADRLEAQAENLRDEGDRREEAIDDSDAERQSNGAASAANAM